MEQEATEEVVTASLRYLRFLLFKMLIPDSHGERPPGSKLEFISRPFLTAERPARKRKIRSKSRIKKRIRNKIKIKSTTIRSCSYAYSCT